VRHRGEVTVHLVADRFRIKTTTAQDRLDRMTREGALERVSRGVYRVKEAGPC